MAGHEAEGVVMVVGEAADVVETVVVVSTSHQLLETGKKVVVAKTKDRGVARGDTMMRRTLPSKDAALTMTTTKMLA